mmetsp:Transcript_11714/g.25332  ORF Transcript_11714/g.25332 Transcript_11714/m.25332 type:complete len:461 (+) Transcript_11714:236-1618(+)
MKIPLWILSSSALYAVVLTIVQIDEVTSFALSDSVSIRSLECNAPLRMHRKISYTCPIRAKSKISCTNIGKSKNDSALYSAVATESSYSYQWHRVPKKSLLGHERTEAEDFIMRECDAIVASHNINESALDADVWVREMHAQYSSKIEKSVPKRLRDEPANAPKEAVEAIQAMHRWSSNFVRRLRLCPWAGSSLDTPGAIRYWVLLVHDDGHDDARNDRINGKRKSDMDESERSRHSSISNNQRAAILDEMEAFVLEAGRHLKQITGETPDPIDPSVAISFVILVDKTMLPLSEPSLPELLPGFGEFHEFFLDLEDRLIDECDEYWDDVADGVAEEEGGEYAEDGPLGCQITIAAFHPQWKFGRDGNNEVDGADQAIDFEKRAPYPSVSIVMSSVIDALVSERVDDDADVAGDRPVTENGPSAPATERIAALNEKTLGDIGTEQLKRLFYADVIQCPTKH